MSINSFESNKSVLAENSDDIVNTTIEDIKDKNKGEEDENTCDDILDTETEEERGEEQSDEKKGNKNSKSEHRKRGSETEDNKEEGDESGEGQFTVAGFDLSALSSEYYEKGELSKNSYKELAEHGFSKELVDTYIAGVKAQKELLEIQEVNEIKAVAGGDEGYDRVMAWADANLTHEEKEAYNKAVTTGDKDIATFVVKGLVSRYERETGKAPKLIKGAGIQKRGGVQGFKNRAEMVKAMSDERYGKDPDYTRSVERRVIAGMER